MNPHEPFDGGHGFHGAAESSLSVLPFLAGSLLLLLLVLALTGLFLWRRGKLPFAGFGTAARPEDEAKRILADRFARGDISSEEFMERASILNWTPGADAVPRRVGRTHS